MFRRFRANSGAAALTLCLALALAGCGEQPGQPGLENAIRLNLRFLPPGERSPFPGTGEQTGVLAKSARLVEDQVLLLHCDDESLTVATDASSYHNDFSLYSVEYNDSENAALKKALYFNGDNSYALSMAYESKAAVLNGTHGFSLSFRMQMNSAGIMGEKRIFDRHDPAGGYTIGVITSPLSYTPRLFFRIKQDSVETTLTSKSVLTPGTWFKVTANYDQNRLAIFFNDKVDTTLAHRGLVSPSTRPTVLGAGWNGDIISYAFEGLLDEISLTTTVDYYDFDQIRVAVVDISDYDNVSDFYRNKGMEMADSLYHMEMHSSGAPTWEDYGQVFRSIGLEVVYNQNLGLDKGFATGTIRGVDGGNLIFVGAIQEGQVQYSGGGFVWTTGEAMTDVVIELEKYEGEYAVRAKTAAE